MTWAIAAFAVLLLILVVSWAISRKVVPGGQPTPNSAKIELVYDAKRDATKEETDAQLVDDLNRDIGAK